MITPADILNGDRPSGYDHVTLDQGGKPDQSKPYRAVYDGTHAAVVRGPRRAHAHAAAQDYCDYINSGGYCNLAPQLKSAGHAKPVSSLPSSPEAIEARKVLREEAQARREGRQGFVYLAIEVKNVFDALFVKIGHTYLDPPEARLAGLQTGNPRQLRMVASRPGTEEDERKLHARYIHYNVLGEWFYNKPSILREFGVK